MRHGGRRCRLAGLSPSDVLTCLTATMPKRERLEPDTGGAAAAYASTAGVGRPPIQEPRRRQTSRNATCGKCVEARVRERRPPVGFCGLHGSTTHSHVL